MRHSWTFTLWSVAAVLAACATTSEPTSAPGGPLADALMSPFAPMVALPAPALDEDAVGGTPLAALSGRDAPIRETLLTFFKDSDMNVLIDEDVTGTATFDISETTVERAFRVLLEHLDLACEFRQDFVLVHRNEHRAFSVDLLNLTNVSVGSDSSSQQGTPSITNIWTELQQDLVSLVADEGRIMVSPMSGLVQVDAPPSVVARVKAHLDNVLDRARNQVSLEARILEVGLSDEFRLGVDWTLLSDWFSSRLVGASPGNVIASQTASAGAGVFRFGVLNEGHFSLFVDALEKQGQVRVLSSPRVSTMNNVPATIQVADQIPVIDRAIIDTEAGSRTEFDVRFVDAGITVTALPQIGADGFITVWLNPKVTEQTGTVTTPDGLQTEPILSTREASTMIRVRDGQAVVIGGLRSTRKIETRNATPFLADIPILGGLFRSVVQTMEDIELVVVLVPRILDSTWVDEELRRCVTRMEALRRPFTPSPIGLEQAGLEVYGAGLLSEAPAEPRNPRMQVETLGRPAAGMAVSMTRRGMSAELFDRAAEAVGAGEFTRALELLDQAAGLDPQAAGALVLAGLIELRTGRFDEAQSHLEQALARRHDDAVALSVRGILELSRGAPEAALPFLEHVHVISPTRLTANNLAAALISTGQPDIARQVMDSVDVDLPEAHVNRAYLFLLEGNPDQAETHIERALRQGVPAGDDRLITLRAMLLRLRAQAQPAPGDGAGQARAGQPANRGPQRG